MQQQAEDLESLWEFEKKPAELEVEGSRVIPWATTGNGECLYWLVRPGHEPDQWTVMVNEARGDRREHFQLSCTQFLTSPLDRELHSNILSPMPPVRHMNSVSSVRYDEVIRKDVRAELI
ncbi:hypothetical protein [Streptomyces sp. NPDC016172]|uniref:hypothetical protein n=1 Tax=Streptomyces sp. NPDC016172 TaxID=3364964 RepID=UPI0036F75680